MKGALLFLLVSVVAMLIVVAQFSGAGDLAGAFLSVKPEYILVIVALQFVMLAVYGERWRLLMGCTGLGCSRKLVMKYVFIGSAFNNITPMVRFGGEPFKAMLLAKELSVKKRQVLASVTADSFVTAVSLLLLIFFGLIGLLAFSILSPVMVYGIGALLVFLLALSLYVFYRRSLLASAALAISRLVSRFSPGRGKKVEGTLLAVREGLGKTVKRGVMAKALSLALAERVLETVSMYLVLLSLGVNLSLYSCAMVLGVGIIFGLIPLLPGGLVAYEYSSMVVLRLMGASPAVAGTSILIYRGVNYWLVTAIGLSLSWLSGIRLAFRDGTGILHILRRRF